ncbi:hypothetical protein P5V15_011271 [Pogonomyrmex californicus]
MCIISIYTCVFYTDYSASLLLPFFFFLSSSRTKPRVRSRDNDVCYSDNSDEPRSALVTLLQIVVRDFITARLFSTITTMRDASTFNIPPFFPPNRLLFLR